MLAELKIDVAVFVDTDLSPTKAWDLPLLTLQHADIAACDSGSTYFSVVAPRPIETYVGAQSSSRGQS